MFSIGMFLVLVVVTFILLCYIFNKSKIELESPTIAAMEARAEMVQTVRQPAGVRRKEERNSEPDEDLDIGVEEKPSMEYEEYEEEPAVEEEEVLAGSPDEEEVSDIPDTVEVTDVHLEEELVAEMETLEPPPAIEVTDYEYRVMLEEGGDNYVLPQWMLNFFSSSDICHTLDPSDNMVIIAKLNNAENAEAGVIDISADCDMGTQTVALKLSFGEGADSETFKTKFYLFERGDLFELGRLVRQSDIRIDILTRGADYTLEYLRTIYSKLPHDVLEKIKGVLLKHPG